MSVEPKGIDRYPKAAAKTDESLLVNEIYAALDGEGPWQGFPVVIVRLMGCNLRCSYCDSQFAYFEGRKIAADSILEILPNLGIKKVLVTGGEPLAQSGTINLLKKLVEEGYEVSIETNGSYSLIGIPDSVVKIVDVKTPDSGESEFFLEENLGCLKKTDCLKFVICSRQDYDWSKEFLNRQKHIECDIVFSPVWKEISPQELSGWILEDRLAVRFAVQLHKALWGDSRGV
jgi:7-carboxy-7-deazaguanine synthase